MIVTLTVVVLFVVGGKVKAADPCQYVDNSEVFITSPTGPFSLGMTIITVCCQRQSDMESTSTSIFPTTATHVWSTSTSTFPTTPAPSARYLVTPETNVEYFHFVSSVVEHSLATQLRLGIDQNLLLYNFEELGNTNHSTLLQTFLSIQFGQRFDLLSRKQLNTNARLRNYFEFHLEDVDYSSSIYRFIRAIIRDYTRVRLVRRQVIQASMPLVWPLGKYYLQSFENNQRYVCYDGNDLNVCAGRKVFEFFWYISYSTVQGPLEFCFMMRARNTKNYVRTLDMVVDLISDPTDCELITYPFNYCGDNIIAFQPNAFPKSYLRTNEAGEDIVLGTQDANPCDSVGNPNFRFTIFLKGNLRKLDYPRC